MEHTMIKHYVYDNEDKNIMKRDVQYINKG